MPLKASEQVAQTTDNKEIRSLLMREYMKKLRTLDDNIGRVYHFLMSHCHPTLQTRMRLEQSFIALAGDDDVSEVLGGEGWCGGSFHVVVRPLALK